ncbi:MAG: metallophosphoesterase family protein [Candidatus Heimdallarchaeota archaeon]
MKIGVLADTHVNELEDLPKKVVDGLTGVDLIVHAGDYTGKDLLDGLRKLGDFKGVFGNMDPPEIRSELRAVEVFEVAWVRIGITHPAEGGAPFKLAKRVRKKFQQVDIIIFGHSHWVKNEMKDHTLYFNPGSTIGSFLTRYKSYGILKIDNGIEARIIKL